MFQVFVQKQDFSGEMIVFQQRAYFYHFFGLFQKIYEKAKSWSPLLSPLLPKYENITEYLII